MSGNPAFSLAEWPSSSACSFAMYGNPAFSMLLLHVVFVVTGNPTFSLGEWPSSPMGGKWQHFCCQVHSDWLSGLGEVGWPFLVLYKYVTELL